MPHVLSKKRIFVSASALTLGAILTLGGAEAATASQSGDGSQDAAVPTGKCIRIYDLTNVMVEAKETIPPGPGPAVGTDTIYHDELSDASGKVVGYTDGRITLVHKRPSDGHVLGYENQVLTIAGAKFRAQGLLDVTDLLVNRTWGHIPATWIGGRYKGWIGDWQYQVEDPTKPPQRWQAKAQLDLCKIKD
jgi:Allene oxide cyclase barrel like domain